MKKRFEYRNDACLVSGKWLAQTDTAIKDLKEEEPPTAQEHAYTIRKAVLLEDFQLVPDEEVIPQSLLTTYPQDVQYPDLYKAEIQFEVGGAYMADNLYPDRKYYCYAHPILRSGEQCQKEPLFYKRERVWVVYRGYWSVMGGVYEGAIYGIIKSVSEDKKSYTVRIVDMVGNEEVGEVQAWAPLLNSSSTLTVEQKVMLTKNQLHHRWEVISASCN